MVSNRLDDDRLRGMALAALEELAARCRHAPQRKTRSLALVLAYLASRKRTQADRYAFDQFWRSVATAYSVSRSANINAAINGIYLAVGVVRQSTTVFEDEARRELGELDGMSRTVVSTSKQVRPRD